MTEATDQTAPESAPAVAETAAQVWERTVNPTPITKEDVKGNKPDAEAAPAETPERALVAPELAKLVAPKPEAAPNPFEERLARIEAALIPAPEPQTPELAEEVASLKQLLLAKEEEAAAQAEAAAEAERLSILREGVIANIRADAERFPLLVGLNQEENVYNTLIEELRAGKEVSEDDIASQAEAKLQEAFDRMNEVKGGKATTTSEAPAEATAPPTPTLTPALSASDTPTDIESVLESKNGDRRAAAAEMWDNIMNG